MSDPGPAPGWLTTIPDYGPIWYFTYFLAEATDLSRRAKVKEAYALLFDTAPGQRSTPQKSALRLKPGLEPEGGPRAYTFQNGNGASIWRDALSKIMLAGFKGVKQQVSDSLTSSLQEALLEERFVTYLSRQAHSGAVGTTQIFWRCDGRPLDVYVTAGTTQCAVAVKDSSEKYNLAAPWNPFSDPAIHNMLWLRDGSSRDNDYFSIISVGTGFRTVCSFPTLDEKKAYQWRITGQSMVPPSQWTAPELTQFQKYLCRVQMTENGRSGTKVRVLTKTHAYLIALNKGVVIDTAAYGGGDKKESTFPEKGVRGIPNECFVGYLPILRLHHGPGREDGFTVFPDPKDPPRLLRSDAQLEHEFGEAGMNKIKYEFNRAVREVSSKLQTAWAANGYSEPEMKPEISGIVTYPPVVLKAPPAD